MSIENAGDEGILDLNKVFQLNVSYNFDLLKTVLDGLLKSQKSMQEELNDLKNKNQEKDDKIRQ